MVLFQGNSPTIATKKQLNIELRDVNDVKTEQLADNTICGTNGTGSELAADSGSAPNSDASKKPEKISIQSKKNGKTVTELRERIRSQTAGKKRNVQDHRLVTKTSLSRLKNGKTVVSCRSKVTNNLKNKTAAAEKKIIEKAQSCEVSPAPAAARRKNSVVLRKPIKRLVNLRKSQNPAKPGVRKNVESKSRKEIRKRTEFYANNNGLDDKCVSLEIKVINGTQSE